MAIGLNAKRKSARSNKFAPKSCIAEWSIEQATTSDYIDVSFVVLNESGDGAGRSTIQRFLLHHDRAEQFIRELNNALADATAIERLEPPASVGLKSTAPSASTSSHGDADDTEALSNHFALGAYGLFGN